VHGEQSLGGLQERLEQPIEERRSAPSALQRESKTAGEQPTDPVAPPGLDRPVEPLGQGPVRRQTARVGGGVEVAPALDDDTAHSFSGGRAQCLMLARALTSRPRIVITDEANSGLDDLPQQVVVSTCIVVAHRLSTVPSADRIVMLDRGRIVEQGRCEQLIADEDGLSAASARGQCA